MFRLFQEDLRASDADRERVAEALKRHYAEGRLSSAELSARVEAAYSAVGLSELGSLTRDLPPLPVASPRERRGANRGRTASLFVWVAGLAVLLVAAQAIPAELWTLLIFFGLPILMVVVFGMLPFALPVLAVAWLARSLGPGRAHTLHLGPAGLERYPSAHSRRGSWASLDR